MNADLVLEGGGMRGIAHVGALTELERHGYRFPRAAGASAGAIVAAFAAAGVSAARLAEMHAELSYNSFREARGLARLGFGGRLAAIVRDNGAFAGDRLHQWLRETLKRESGVEHFGDLRLPPDSAAPPSAEHERYSLVVVVADLSLGQLVRLPWDYHRLYGLDPDRQPVADAVLASTSIPFFFKPFRLRWAEASLESHLVDGGLVSDFPVGIFDRTDGLPPRWPTFGVKLSRRRPEATVAHAIDGVRSFATALFETAVSGNDQAHLSDPCVASRTIFVDHLGIPSTRFDLAAEQRAALFASGQDAAARFLARWDWQSYLRECRGVDA